MTEDISAQLAFLYGDDVAAVTWPRLQALLASYRDRLPPSLPSAGFFDQEDAVLITYGDMVQDGSEPPLATLAGFLEQTVREAIDTVHLLPFFPYSSDDGFSIIDYQVVDPALGTWDDVAAFRHTFRLMFDAVVNHVSAQSGWFQAFLQGRSPYEGYFIIVPADASLNTVFRPRALPLVTEFQTAAGPRGVWTTFSADQVDLNFHNPDVLLEVIDTLLFYVMQGASLIRLDAIAFIWKETGTSCIHLPQTHCIIQLLRSVLDLVAPQVVLITETNVPHEDNISYFGDGRNEAQMVYNFSLPPLTLDAFHRQDAAMLSTWAAGLVSPSPTTTFFNFLASHDGVGLTPARGLLSETAIADMAQRVEALGGFVSYRSNSDGAQSPYELNISYLDALGDPDRDEDNGIRARRFLAAQAIMLALQGVPGIYFHSLFGSENWSEGVAMTGQKRSINRQKLERDRLLAELADPGSIRALVHYPYVEMLAARRVEPAFHPNGGQQILFLHEAVFALWRHGVNGSRHVLCLHNVSANEVALDVPLDDSMVKGEPFIDLLSGEPAVPDGRVLRLQLPPYGVRWFGLS